MTARPRAKGRAAWVRDAIKRYRVRLVKDRYGYEYHLPKDGQTYVVSVNDLAEIGRSLSDGTSYRGLLNRSGSGAMETVTLG